MVSPTSQLDLLPLIKEVKISQPNLRTALLTRKLSSRAPDYEEPNGNIPCVTKHPLLHIVHGYRRLQLLSSLCLLR